MKCYRLTWAQMRQRTWTTFVQWDQRTFTSLRQCHEKRCQTSSEEPSPRRDLTPSNQNTLVSQCSNLDAVRDGAGSHEAFLAVGQKWGQDQSGPAPMDIDSMTRAKTRAMIARARRKETARASSPRKREERDSKVTAKTVVNGGASTERLLVETWKASEQCGN